MQNISVHVETIVREALAVKCRNLGIDRNEVGYAVGGFGDVGPVMNNQGGAQFAPHWMIVVSLRHRLIGRPPLGLGLPVAGALPGDDEFRQAADRLLEAVSAQREQEFSGPAVPDITSFGGGQ